MKAMRVLQMAAIGTILLASLPALGTIDGFSGTAAAETSSACEYEEIEGNWVGACVWFGSIYACHAHTFNIAGISGSGSGCAP